MRRTGGETTITATLSHPSSDDTEVTLTATAAPPATDADFRLSGTTLTIPAGDEASDGSVTLTATTNPEDEPDKTVTLRGTAANDQGVTGPAAVTLTIEDDDPPEVGGEAAVTLTEGNTRAVATYTATTHAGGGITWSLDVPNDAVFTITNGALRFRQPPDHEDPDNPYTVTVRASDGTLTGELEVTITVQDAPGTLSLAPPVSQAGRAVIATLTDLDDAVGESTNHSWRWERSTDPEAPDGDWEDLGNATDRYTPRGIDVLFYLRVTVDYTDGAGTPKTGMQIISEEAVRAAPRRPSTPPGTPGGGGGGGGGSGEEPPPAEPVGYLENPGPDSFQSGVGVLSGWVCEAEVVEIELNGVAQSAAYSAAYGTERLDTESVCGDTDNGFGLLFNWNRLDDGEHEVVAFVDGVELGRATVTVTTLGEEFLRGAAGECEVADFPTLGERVTLVWQQNQQNFVLGEGSRPSGEQRAGSAGIGYLENPGANSFQSGVGVISGWVCEAERVEILLGELAPMEAGYGTERLDTLESCGDTDNGFGLLFNWNRLEDGEHMVRALVDGEELGWTTVRVTTLGEEFVRGAEGMCEVDDFPMSGQTVTLEWQQNQQNFVITEVE